MTALFSYSLQNVLDFELQCLRTENILAMESGNLPALPAASGAAGGSDSLKFIQESFKEAGRKPRRLENNI